MVDLDELDKQYASGPANAEGTGYWLLRNPSGIEQAYPAMAKELRTSRRVLNIYTHATSIEEFTQALLEYKASLAE